jgi:tetratricopeptide (TPR) repeat protein
VPAWIALFALAFSWLNADVRYAVIKLLPWALAVAGAAALVLGLILLRRAIGRRKSAPAARSSVGSGRSIPKTLQDALGQGRHEESTGRWEDAISAYRHAVRINPGSLEAWSALGRLSERLGRWNEAVQAYREAIAIDRRSAVAWHGLGVVYQRGRRYQESIEALREAVQCEPIMVDAWIRLGVIESRLGHHDEAVEAFRQATKHRPESTYAWFGLAVTLERLGDVAQASDAYQTALRYSPSLVPAYYNLGILQREQGRLDEAAQTFLAGVRLAPRDAELWYGLGITYAKQSNEEGMRVVHSQLAAIEPDAAEEFAESYFMRSALTPSGRAAVNHTARHAQPPRPKGVPTPADAWYDIGVSHVRNRQIEEALAAFREAVRLNPEHTKAWFRLGRLNRQYGDLNDALRAFRVVVRRRRRMAMAWNELGIVFGELGASARACQVFRTAVRLRPDFVEAWWGLGAACAMTGDARGLQMVHAQLQLLDPRVAEAFDARVVLRTTEDASGAMSGTIAPFLASESSGMHFDFSTHFVGWLDSLSKEDQGGMAEQAPRGVDSKTDSGQGADEAQHKGPLSPDWR